MTSAISELPGALWRLALVVWVGSFWLGLWVVPGALQLAGLAPALVDEVMPSLVRQLLWLSAGAALLQWLLLGFCLGWRRGLWADVRAVLSLVVAAWSGVGLFLAGRLPEGGWIPSGLLLIGLCGLLLVILPVPVRQRAEWR